MPRGAKIDAGLRAEIVAAYLADETVTYKDLAQRYFYSAATISRIIHEELKDSAGIRPDRRKKAAKRNPDGSEGITEGKLDRQHAERMAEKAKAEHPRTSDWMDHITPLHKHRQELENAVEHKQVELEKAKQELRDFLATLRQLMEETV